MGYNMMDNMVDSVFVSVLGLNFHCLLKRHYFPRNRFPRNPTVIVLILNITINTSGKSCSIFFFSVCSCTIFFLNVKCLLDIFWGFYPPPIKNQMVRPLDTTSFFVLDFHRNSNFPCDHLTYIYVFIYAYVLMTTF